MGIQLPKNRVIMQNFLVFAALIALSSAHTGLLREGCPPKPPTKLDFDATKYLGDWYQATGTPAFFQPSGTSCVKATYSAKMMELSVFVIQLLNPTGKLSKKSAVMLMCQIPQNLVNSKFIFLSAPQETTG